MATVDTSAAEIQAEEAKGLDNPTLALNLSGVSDWGSAMQFINLMNTARDWIGHKPGQWGGMTYAELLAGGYVDEDGWIVAIPKELGSIGTIWDWNESYGANERAGTYVLTYEGEGTIQVAGTIIRSEPGKITFTLKEGQDLMLSITATDPAGTGNYIRDIAVVAEENLALYEAGAVFNPEWLNLIDDTRQIRFMDWMETNNATITSWDDRATPENMHVNSSGMPVEYMVQLANEIGADPWFTMPHTADENYIRQFATYVRDNLDEGLTARVEYSNEVWNFAFQQTQWVLAQAKAEWGNDAFYSYYAKMATQTALIWKEVFAETGQQDQLITVISSQTANPWLTEQILQATAWQENEPDAYVKPGTVFDELAITTYFGGAETSDAALRNQLIAAIKNPAVDAKAWLAEKLMDPSYPWSIPYTAAKWQEQKAVAEKYGLALTAYEGGQHVHHAFAVQGLTDTDLAVLTGFMTDFVRSDEMAALYEQLWHAWAEVSDGPFMQFGDVEAPSKWGSWALYSSLTDENPRAALLEQLNATETPWWNAEGGSQYQQGVILQARDMEGGNAGVLLAGTAKIDYLIGGAGNDIFVASAGDDGINGGAGVDRIILSGAAADYRIAVEGDGYRLTGPDGSKFLVSIEEFGFDDDELFVLEEMLAGKNIPVPPPVTGEPDPDTDTPPDTGTGNGQQPDPDDTDGGQTGGGDTGGEDTGALEPEPVTGGAIAVAGTLLRHDAPSGTITIDDSAIPATGVTINAINSFSVLGKELGLQGGDTTASYTINARNASVDFNGMAVGGSYWSLQDNRAAQNGVHLSDTALETALRIGSVITHASAIVATSGNDAFYGRDLSDVVYGGAGQDYLAGAGGNDSLYGGEGKDTIHGGDGNDLVDGGADSDELYGGAGNDTINAGTGNDKIYGGDGIDRLILSGAATDHLLTAEGAGWRLGGPDGSKYLEGVEEFAFETGDVLSMDDMLALADNAPAVNRTVALAGQVVNMSGTTGAAVVDNSAAPGTGVTISAINVWSMIGQELGLNGSDTTASYAITAKGASANFGGAQVAGNYWSLHENRASQTGPALSGSALETALKLGSVVTNAAIIFATDGDDMFQGRDLADTVHMGAGNDVVYGGGGDDIIIGGAGNDLLFGGAGNDTFVFGAGSGQDTICDFTAEDILDLGDLLPQGRTLAEAAGLDANGDLYLSNGTDQITFRGLDLDDLGLFAFV